MNNNLVKKTGLYLIGNISSKLVSFFLIPIYAFYVTAEDLGNYDYYQTIMLILVPFIFIAIWEAILKFLLKNEENKVQIISTSVIFVISICFVTVFIAYSINGVLKTNVENFNLIIMMILSYALACIWQYYARGLKRNNIYVISSIIGTLVNFFINILCLCVFNLGIKSLYIAYIISQSAIFIILEYNLQCIRSVKFKYFNFKLLKEMLIFSSPLVLNLVSMWFISGFGRTLINKELGSEMQGLYAFANKFGIIINVFGSVISMALIEESIIKSREEGLGEYFSKTIQKLFMIFLSIIILAAPIITIFYKFIKTTQYYNSINMFAYFLLYATFMTMSTNVGAIFQTIEKTKFIFITTLLGSISTVIFSKMLISSMGIIGVAIGQILGAIVMLISRYKICNKYLKLKLDIKKILFMLFIYVLSVIVSIKTGIIISLVVLITNIVIILILNKEDIEEIILYIKSFINKVRRS